MKSRSARHRASSGLVGVLVACASASILAGVWLAAGDPAQTQTTDQTQTASQQTGQPTGQATNPTSQSAPANAPQQSDSPAHKEVVPAVPKPKPGATPSTPATDKSKDAAQAGQANQAASNSTGKDAAQAATKDESGKPVDEDTDPAPKKGPATASDKAGSPQRFVPSEQVRADFDVSFPIDI